VNDLGRLHRGPVITPDDRRFDAARRTFNASIEARPAVISRPVDSRDVAAAIAFARAHDLPVSVRGGGHSVAGHSVGEGSVMVDLRLLREVDVGPVARTATVGGGACWNDVDAPSQSFGLAMPGGTYGDTGVAGLTLTGGIGHLTGAYGLSLDNLLSAEVVTADGRVIRANRDDEPELFWALRGGGGNFGVVTEFVFQLHEVPLMTGGFLIHRLQDAPEALRAFARMRDDMPSALTLMPQLLPSAGLIEADHVLLTSVAFLGAADRASEVLAPLRSPRPLFDNVGPAYYSQLQALYPYMPFGLRNYWTGRFIDDLSDDLIDFMVEHLAGAPAAGYGGILFEPLHGAVSEVHPSATAFAFRSARFNVSPMAVWEDPADDEGQLACAAAARDRLQPLSRGGYLNYATDDSEETVEGSFGSENFRRLRSIKATWDPDNVFRFNHNIAPAPD